MIATIGTSNINITIQTYLLLKVTYSSSTSILQVINSVISKTCCAFMPHIPLSPALCLVHGSCSTNIFVEEMKKWMKIPPGMQRGGLSPHTLEFFHSRDCRAWLANSDGVALVSDNYISIHLPQTLLFNIVLLVTLVFTVSYLGKYDSYTFVTLHLLVDCLTRFVITITKRCF